MKINLHRAQKLHTALTHSSREVYVTNTFRITYDITSSGQKIKKSIENQIELEHQKLNDLIDINQDLSDLKMAIFSANMINGNHEMISSLNLLKKKINLYKNVLVSDQTDLKSINDIGVSDLDTKIDFLKQNGSEYSKLDILVFSNTELQLQIKSLSKELESLEDKLASSNINTVIDFHFSKASLKLLNLD